MASGPTRYLVLGDDTRLPGDPNTPHALRNRAAFTSRDMAADWPEAFAYAVIHGWGTDPADLVDGEDPDAGWNLIAARHGWNADIVDFLKDAHARFAALPDTPGETP